MPDHPPLPDHPRFRVNPETGEDEFLPYEPDRNKPDEWCPIEDIVGGLIAADCANQARCAFLDEAWADEFNAREAQLRFGHGECHEADDLYAEAEGSFRNADAWAAWGRERCHA